MIEVGCVTVVIAFKQYFVVFVVAAASTNSLSDLLSMAGKLSPFANGGLGGVVVQAVSRAAVARIKILIVNFMWLVNQFLGFVLKQ